jgi:rhodanese-related sulfurtransferase
MKASSLDKNKKYVIFCDTGRRSSAASFLLNEKDIETYVLTDGVDTAAPEDLVS